jgi:hypothetical protein
MASTLLVALHIGAPLTKEHVLAQLDSMSLGGLLDTAVREFSLSLILGCLWLILGRRRDMDVTHLGVPVLAGSLQATLRTIGFFDFGFRHPIFFLMHIIESLIALSIIAALIVLVVVLRRSRGAANSHERLSALRP